MTTKLTLHVEGMHCVACTRLTEETALDVPFIHNARSDHASGVIEVEGDFAEVTPHEVASALTNVFKKHGYAVFAEKPHRKNQLADFALAVPIALAFAVGFALLQRAGLVNLVPGGSLSFGTAFLIGIVASLSTCMAVVGGLVLSMSASFSKSGDTVRSQVLFHAGRLVSFVILGGVIGAIGSAFSLSTTASFAIGVAVALVMFILGVNLLDVFRFSKRLQLSAPKSVTDKAFAMTKLNHTLTPLLTGVATFFLPCGFTQSMQLYALSTGSFVAGALTMGAFALGTLPVLSLVSVSPLSIGKSKYRGVFLKSAGLIVIMFALYNLLTAFVALGVVDPIFSF